MKKTQVALAALAMLASSAVLAEVTLYGTIDAAVQRVQGTSMHMDGAGGFSAGNNFGIRGSGELDNGMSVNFTLQQGYNLRQGAADNGGGAGASFNQVAAVGLSGNFGTLTLGQQLSPYIATFAGGMKGNGNFFVNHIIQASGGNAAGGGANQAGGFFVPNAISYSQDLGFAKFQFMSATPGDSAPGAAIGNGATNKYTAGSLTGDLGIFSVGFAFDSRRNLYRNQVLTASTQAGDIGLSASFNNFAQDVPGTSGNNYGSWSVSASYPLSEATTLVGQYANGQAVLGTDSSLTALHVRHALSKTTSVYATWGRGTGGANPTYVLRGQAAADGVSQASVGVAHSF